MRTLLVTDCTRDIFALIEDARRVSSDSDHYVKDFLRSLVSDMVISANDTLMEIALLSNSVDKQWGLTDHDTEADLLQAIDSLKFSHTTASVDLDEIFDFVRHEALKHRHGERHGIPNDLIILLDHRADTADPLSRPSGWLSHELALLSGDVIVISVGATTKSSVIESLATDPSHVLQVASYDQLFSIKDELLVLLCT